MKPHLERKKGRIVYADAKGRRYDYAAVLARRRQDAVGREIRQANTMRGIWWRLMKRSSDVPNSRAARADVSDGGSGAEEIRRKAEDATSYHWRLRLATAYLAAHTRQPPEKIDAFLKAVFRNGKRYRRVTIAELGITKRWYTALIDLYSTLLESQQWHDFREGSAKWEVKIEKS